MPYFHHTSGRQVLMNSSQSRVGKCWHDETGGVFLEIGPVLMEVGICRCRIPAKTRMQLQELMS